MEESNSYYLSEIVDEYLSQYRLPESSYRRVFRLALRAREYLHLHACGKPVTDMLPVQADKTVQVPCECLNIITVEYDSGSDKKITLEENDDLSIQNSYYYDRDGGCLRLGSEFSESELLLTYLPQASDDNGDYLVPPIFIQALIDWVIWQDGRGNPKVGRSDTRQDRVEFFESLRIAKRAVKPFSLDQVYKQYSRLSTNNLSVYKWN